MMLKNLSCRPFLNQIYTRFSILSQLRFVKCCQSSIPPYEHNEEIFMKTKQKTRWRVDAVLFTGFIATFFLDLTGVELHQWIGVFGGALAVYHLLSHWDWASAVTQRFFGGTSGKARQYYA